MGSERAGIDLACSLWFRCLQAALVELLRAAQDWQPMLEQCGRREGAAFDRVDLSAWHTLGDALLVIGLYDQDGSRLGAGRGETISAARRIPRVAAAAAAESVKAV